MKLKRILAALLVASLLIGLVSGVVLADSHKYYPVVLISVMQHDTYTNQGVYYQVFEPQFDIELSTTWSAVKVNVKRYIYGAADAFYIRLYALGEYDEGEEYWPVVGEPLAESLETDDSLTFTYGDDWEDGDEYIWLSCPAVSEGIILEEGLMYTVVVERVGTSGTIVWARSSADILSNAFPALGYSSGPGARGPSGIYGDDGDLNFQITGYWTDKSSVSTLPGYFDSAGALVLTGMVHSLGPDDKVEAYIDYGVVDTFGNEKDCGFITAPGAAGMFTLRLYELPEGLTIYYRARIVGVPSGIEKVGAARDIYCPGGNVSLTSRVIENSPERVGFEVIVEDMGGCEEVGLNISYAQSYCGLTSNPDSLLVADAVAARGVYIVYDTDSFEGGKTYYFRGVMMHSGDVVAVSEFHTFTRYDTSKPGIVNWVVALLDKYGLGGGTGGTMGIDWFWWLLVFIGICFVWLLSAKHKQKWIGVVGTFVMVGFMIAFGLVDIWLVVLLAIVAGFIIYKVVFKHSGVTGGGG